MPLARDHGSPRYARDDEETVYRQFLHPLAFALRAALADSLNIKVGARETTTTTITGMPVPAAALENMTATQRAGIEKAMQARSLKAVTIVEKKLFYTKGPRRRSRSHVCQRTSMQQEDPVEISQQDCV